MLLLREVGPGVDSMGLLWPRETDAKMPDPKHKWRTPEIVYLGIVSVVLVAAVLEWALMWIAFTYCYWQVYRKATNWSTKFLAVFQGSFYSMMRCAFFVVMMVTLPLPPQLVKDFPPGMVTFFQWFAFCTFAVLLTVPWICNVYLLIVNDIGRRKRPTDAIVAATAPKVMVVMPCHNEKLEVLMAAIESVLDSDYPMDCVHLFLSFDGDGIGDLYKNAIRSLGGKFSSGYPTSGDIVYRGARITVSRFRHGGKRHCQGQTFALIDRMYQEYQRRNQDLYQLFIDSDCILDKHCIQNFMWDMHLKPGCKRKINAMTGVITSTTKRNSFLTILQDIEYLHGQLFERTVESGCGSVTCLPGALTMLRYSAFRRVAKYYFAEEAGKYSDMFDFSKCHLGEDRWLTHLFMVAAQKPHQLQMCTGAFCKTEAVETFKHLLKQRRRWFLGFITNEVCLLTDLRCWRRYPLLCLLRLMHNTIRTTSLLFFIMILSVLTTANKIGSLPVGFIAVVLGLNYALMFYFGIRLRRLKAWLYVIMFVVNPFFNWMYTVYGMFTAGSRTWGGPRADAGVADATTTAREVIERADQVGDDLNIVPESFRPAAQTMAYGHGTMPSPVALHPTDRVEGRFGVPERDSGGSYTTSRESLVTLPDHLVRHSEIPPFILSRSSSSSTIASSPWGGELVRPQKDLEAGYLELGSPQSVTKLLGAFEEVGLDSAERPSDQSPVAGPSTLPPRFGTPRTPIMTDNDGEMSGSPDRLARGSSQGVPLIIEPASSGGVNLAHAQRTPVGPGGRPFSMRQHTLPRSPLGRASFERRATSPMLESDQNQGDAAVEMIEPGLRRASSQSSRRSSRLLQVPKKFLRKNMNKLRRGTSKSGNDKDVERGDGNGDGGASGSTS